MSYTTTLDFVCPHADTRDYKDVCPFSKKIPLRGHTRLAYAGMSRRDVEGLAEVVAEVVSNTSWRPRYREKRLRLLLTLYASLEYDGTTGYPTTAATVRGLSLQCHAKESLVYEFLNWLEDRHVLVNVNGGTAYSTARAFSWHIPRGERASEG